MSQLNQHPIHQAQNKDHLDQFLTKFVLKNKSIFISFPEENVSFKDDYP